MFETLPVLFPTRFSLSFRHTGKEENDAFSLVFEMEVYLPAFGGFTSEVYFLGLFSMI
jgi:hypothetical protein